ncbi:MAG TPA: YceI family protein [Candidatus Dormibacteraeota bacterium]|nr:YceI family protein [Candidatus Dormibacteraeota bacterium]
MGRLQRLVLLGAVVLIAIVAIAAIGARLLLGSHQSPSPFALASGEHSGSVSALAGQWTTGSGSLVGYRAKEQFINQPSETEAVARTSSVKGTLVVAVEGGTVNVSKMKFTVDLASLTSQDKYATYQVYQRDFFVRTVYLETTSFPTATFVADSVKFPLPTDGEASVDVPGKLTVHGVTKAVTAHVQASSTGSQAEVVGSMDVDMRDFAIDPPDISFTRAEPGITIEFDLKLVHT